MTKKSNKFQGFDLGVAGVDGDMQATIPTNHPKINVAFIQELEAFKARGYQFNGSGKALFPGTQREAFDAYLNGVKNNHHGGYFEIPTGVGKTALFIAVIGCYLRATENIPNAPRVLIHEPTLDLVTQTALAFADFMPDIAKELETEDDTGREIDWENSAVEVHYGNRKGAKNEHRVLITTYQSQASDERKVETADSFKVQVKKLCQFITSKHLTEEQQQEACEVLNSVLAEVLIGPDDIPLELAPDNLRKSAKYVAEAIEKDYSDAPDLKVFLQAFQGRNGVSRTNPLKNYRPQLVDDKEAAIQKRTFKAEDFHLVIHDEAHYLTGEKYGPAAVDKFKGAIQLGVTATPEYSKTKTVANKLGHRYYNLPLNTAIERGDLCHVRPIVLKTSITVDRKKAKEFLEKQQARPLSNKQLEQLLNQTARNQAILGAYLAGEHPDTGERFLGQTGMIFAGGITHCDDFVRDAYKLLDKPAYREIKNWLRDEGLALIAPVHGEVPKAGVEVVIGGKKKLCTKDEIKELHRAGKILLLISDQELKLGTDFPMDSFIAELVDRFSVPDATQRVGRGFRVDRGTPRYNLPPNPDKSCVVLNTIDQNTHEIYAGTRHYPIHAIEILQGAEHRPPGRKKGSLSRFKKHPPEATEALEAAGFELITRVDEIRDVAKRFEEGEKKEILSSLPEGYWSGSRLGKAIKDVNPDIKSNAAVLGSTINSHIRQQHKTSDVALWKDVPISKDAIKSYISAGKDAYGLREAECLQITEAYEKEYKEKQNIKLKPAKRLIPSGYWPTQKLGQAVKDIKPDSNSTPNTLGNYIVGNIRNQHAINKIALFKEVPIPRVAIAEYDAANGKAYALREAECKKIVHAYASEKERLPNAGYWSGQKLGEAIKNIRPDIPKSTYELGYYINSHIRRQHQASKIAIFKQVPIPKVAITEYNAANGKAYALREAECKKIVHAYALEKQVLLPPGYWPTQKLGQALKDVRTDLKSTPNTLGNHIVSNIRKQHATNEIALFKDVPIPRVAIAEYTANGKAYALREAECRQIIDAYAREARINDIKSDNGDSSIKEINQAHISREKLKTKSIQPRGIKPGDEGLKKTGRGRGQGET